MTAPLPDALQPRAGVDLERLAAFHELEDLFELVRALHDIARARASRAECSRSSAMTPGTRRQAHAKPLVLIFYAPLHSYTNRRSICLHATDPATDRFRTIRYPFRPRASYTTSAYFKFLAPALGVERWRNGVLALRIPVSGAQRSTRRTRRAPQIRSRALGVVPGLADKSMVVSMADMVATRTTRITMAACATFMATLLVASSASADRLNDKDVKQLLERIDNERDRFEDQLDGKLKRSIIRGPGGEVNVEKYLDDLQENVDKLKDRFTPQYAASAEVTTVLDDLKQDAQKLASVVGDGRPASGEAKALLDSASRIRASTSGRALSPAVQTAWGAVEGGLDKVALAFGLPARRP